MGNAEMGSLRCLLTFALLAGFLTGPGDAQRQAPLKPPLKPPIKPAQTNVAYGEHPRNRLDFYQAESDTPTPVLIFFHGGGFVGGDKRRGVQAPASKAALQNGISVVSANYRFVRGKNSEPFPGSLMDGVRAIQFVRSKAKEWNLDAKRVALCGGSAGGLMSVWIAVHDDFADKNSDDPVKRQSSRVKGVIGYGAQTTVDPATILKEIGGNPIIHPSVPPIYGVKSLDELKTEEMQKRVKDFSAISHVTKDDPPMQLHYGGKLAGTPLPKTTNIGVSIHHAKFGDILRTAYRKNRAKQKIEVVASDTDDRKATELEFLKRVFGLK